MQTLNLYQTQLVQGGLSLEQNDAHVPKRDSLTALSSIISYGIIGAVGGFITGYGIVYGLIRMTQDHSKNLWIQALMPGFGMAAGGLMCGLIIGSEKEKIIG